MKHSSKFVVLALALLFFPAFSTPSLSEPWRYFFTGEQLLKWAKDWDQQSRWQYIDNSSPASIKTALGAEKYKFYVAGTQQALSDIDCYPPGITSENIYEIVYTYLKNHPAHRQQPASYLIRMAIYDAFGDNTDTARDNAKDGAQQ